MKKRLIISTLLLITFSIASNLYAKERLTISAPPTIWASKEGDKLTGPIVEILKQVFPEGEVEIEFISLPWARAIERLKGGQLDLMPVIFFTQEREKHMAFTEPYTSVPTTIFVPEGKAFPFTKPADLKGKKGVKMRGDSISSEFAAMEDQLNVMEITSYEQMIKMLCTGRADYAVAAYYGFVAETKRLDCATKVENLKTPLATRNLHFAISKKSPFIKRLPEINIKLKEMKSDGTIKKMIDTTMRMASAE